MAKEKKFLHRMVFSYTLVFGVIFLLIMGLLYFLLYNNMREEARLNHQMLVGQPLDQLERFLGEMEDIAYKAMTNETLIRKFSALRDAPRETDGNHYDQDVLDSIDTTSVLTGINGRLMAVRRIVAYNDKGDFVSSGAIVDKTRVREVLAARNVAALMERFRSEERDFWVSLPGRDDWMEYFKDDYITLTRPIMNVYSRDVVGIVEVQRNCQVLESYLHFTSDTPLALNIYDDQGRPALLQGRADDRVVASAVSESYGWTVELLEPVQTRRDEALRLLAIMAFTWLALSAVVFVVINVIAARISRPLTDLTAAVRGINAGSPGRVRVEGVEIDEIVALESAFNHMLESLTLSMDQEKKSFLLAMQAQMNPHFLYNVLSVINAVALEGRSDKVVDICGNLSAMLRYSASYVQGTATVREELEHTVAYLKLMKSRYDYMFDYTVDMDEALAETVIPKLVIQPLCENCFTHGFDNIEPPYRIAIRLETIPGGWSIRVADNGIGFGGNARRRTLERANNASYEDLNKMKIGGLGLTSSVVRLKLITGKDIRCDIQPNGERGSVVVIAVTEKPDSEEGSA